MKDMLKATKKVFNPNEQPTGEIILAVPDADVYNEPEDLLRWIEPYKHKCKFRVFYRTCVIYDPNQHGRETLFRHKNKGISVRHEIIGKKILQKRIESSYLITVVKGTAYSLQGESNSNKEQITPKMFVDRIAAGRTLRYEVPGAQDGMEVVLINGVWEPYDGEIHKQLETEIIPWGACSASKKRAAQDENNQTSHAIKDTDRLLTPADTTHSSEGLFQLRGLETLNKVPHDEKAASDIILPPRRPEFFNQTSPRGQQLETMEPKIPPMKVNPLLFSKNA